MAITQDELQQNLAPKSFWASLTLFDWAFAALFLAGAVFAHMNYSGLMDIYEVAILYATVPAIAYLGWRWKALRGYFLAVTLISLFAVWIYGDNLALQNEKFFLKYMISSTSAIMWMCALYIMATVAYFAGLLMKSEFSSKVGSAMTWSASTMGLVGLMVRWRESYLMGADVGHIPVSNLYEVFIIFAIMTAVMYLYYEGRYKTRGLGGFVLLVISAAVAFLLWYHFDRQAHEIQPLIPALQSWWMKIHVPANFVGYGAFAISAMLGVVYLLQHYYQHPSRVVAIVVPIVIFIMFALWTMAKGYKAESAISSALLMKSFGVGLIWAVCMSMIGWAGYAKKAQASYPTARLIDDIMYKSIALGFAFFTIATVLGAMWAAEAWGGYWSWDPKETWALIVWLNYAAWLHLRLTKGWRGTVMAWWAIIGLFVTLFAFLGVNMFLTGLHSYGEL